MQNPTLCFRLMVWLGVIALVCVVLDICAHAIRAHPCDSRLRLYRRGVWGVRVHILLLAHLDFFLRLEALDFAGFAASIAGAGVVAYATSRPSLVGHLWSFPIAAARRTKLAAFRSPMPAKQASSTNAAMSFGSAVPNLLANESAVHSGSASLAGFDFFPGR